MLNFNSNVGAIRQLRSRLIDLAYLVDNYVFLTQDASGHSFKVGDVITFAVDVAAFVQTEEDIALHHRSAKMIWNEIDIRSPRLQVHVQPRILRHMVELYLTKRIDTVRMSMKIAIEREIIINSDPNSELLPVLDGDGRLYFRRTECELLAVQASLARERIRR